MKVGSGQLWVRFAGRAAVASSLLLSSACGSADVASTSSAPETEPDADEVSSELLAATGQAIVAGGEHACVILEGGGIKCWGLNDVGQLGYGDTLDRGDQAGEMGDALPFVNLGAGKVAKALLAGRLFSCALLTTGQVKCWGSSYLSGLGAADGVDHGSELGTMGDSLPVIDLGTGRTAKAIAGTLSHVCAILDTNQVKCWGANALGQLGYGDTEARGDEPGEMGDNLPIVYLGAGRTALQIIALDSATCALLDDKSVKCWGYGGAGLLGTGNLANLGDSPGEMQALLPIDFGTGLTVQAIYGSNATACALFTNGQIKCWGANYSGELGLGDTNNRGDQPGEMGGSLPFVNLGTSPTVKSLAVGSSHICALLDLNEAIPGQITTNQVKCWGGNGVGQLGLGDTNDRGDQPNEMGNNLPLVPLGAGRSARAVSASYASYAVLDNGQVRAWGDNGNGELGLGDTSNRGDQPNEVGQLPAVSLGARSIASFTGGSAHVCARLPVGDVKCWGDNTYGQLGLGDVNNRGDVAGEMGANLPTVPLGTAKIVTALDAGDNHDCALLSGGSVKCWGQNTYGQLGLGDTLIRGDQPNEMGDALPAVALGTGKLAKAVVGGGNHSCALLTTNEVKCWGDNQFGQLGLGDTNHRGDQPNEMADTLPAIDFGTRVPKALAAGSLHTCALFTSNEVACWGYGLGGRLGLGNNVARGGSAGQMGASLAVVNLGTGLTAKAIATGDSHTCALLSNNQVKCWGMNAYGQLGLGDVANRGDNSSVVDGFLVSEMGDNLPVIALGTGRTAKAVYAGGNKTCVLLDTNQVKCWGEGYLGALGRGDEQNRGDSPEELGDFAPTIALGTGRTVLSMTTGYTACALLDSNQLKCWGNNFSGQLGRGDRLRRGAAPDQMGDFLPSIDLGPELPP